MNQPTGPQSLLGKRGVSITLSVVIGERVKITHKLVQAVVFVIVPEPRRLKHLDPTLSPKTHVVVVILF